MRRSLFSIFKYSVVVLLVFSSLAKFISTGSDAKIFQYPDPLFMIPFRYMLWFAGGIELAVAMGCIATKNRLVQVTAIAWLGTDLLLYRFGLWLGDYHKPCACLGSLRDG